ncbi:MAG: MarR family winged helix-turn-helix transcriptional regulator [Ruminiclostridium sp.]
MEIQEILGYLLNTSAKLIKRSMDKYLEKYGITTSQWAVLKLLDTKDQLTQTQIANELLGDKATAGDIILRLCGKNYIEKAFDKNDRRAYVVKLTPAAKKMITDIERMANDVSSKALEGLNEGDIQALYKALNQIIGNLSK